MKLVIFVLMIARLCLQFMQFLAQTGLGVWFVVESVVLLFVMQI